MTDIIAPEIKAIDHDAKEAFAEFERGFEIYKEGAEKRIRDLEDARRRSDDRALKDARPSLSASAHDRGDADQREHKQAFDAYMRAGEFSGLKELERKALSAGSGPDGGYLAPPTTEDAVLQRLSTLSPIRGIAATRRVSGGTYKKAFSTTGAASGWVGETAARPETASPALAELSFPTMELYAMPAATQTILDDAIVDVDSWLVDEIETAFAEQESAALVNGTGVNQPKGFLNYPKVENGAWSWGNLGYLATGVAGGFAAANPSDQLVDLIYSLKGAYRQNASFVMNRRTQAAVRKFKSTTGEYLWTPPATVGQPARLMGFPVVEVEEMPNIAADSFSIAFGDFRRGYLVVDRAGLRVLRDPYSAKPYVLFYTTKRVGGGVQDFDAIKLLKFGA